MDRKHLWLSRLNSIIATLLHEKMFRCAVDAYKKWILILKLRSSKSIHLTSFLFSSISPVFRAIFSQLFQEFSHERLLHSGSS